jgi:hypothetical protein
LCALDVGPAPIAPYLLSRRPLGWISPFSPQCELFHTRIRSIFCLGNGTVRRTGLDHPSGGRVFAWHLLPHLSVAPCGATVPPFKSLHVASSGSDVIRPATAGPGFVVCAVPTDPTSGPPVAGTGYEHDGLTLPRRDLLPPAAEAAVVSVSSSDGPRPKDPLRRTTNNYHAELLWAEVISSSILWIKELH